MTLRTVFSYIFSKRGGILIVLIENFWWQRIVWEQPVRKLFYQQRLLCAKITGERKVPNKDSKVVITWRKPARTEEISTLGSGYVSASSLGHYCFFLKTIFRLGGSFSIGSWIHVDFWHIIHLNTWRWQYMPKPGLVCKGLLEKNMCSYIFKVFSLCCLHIEKEWLLTLIHMPGMILNTS